MEKVHCLHENCSPDSEDQYIDVCTLQSLGVLPFTVILNTFSTPPLLYYNEPLILKCYDRECKLFSIKSDPQNQVQRKKIVCDRGETVKKRHPLTEKSQSGSSIATLGFGGSSLSFKDFIIWDFRKM